MSIGTVSQPVNSGQMLQEIEKSPLQKTQDTPQGIKEDSSTIGDGQAGDSTQISNDAKPQKSAFLEKLKGWVKKAVENQQKQLTTGEKVQRVALSTVVGAASGAAMIATGTAPLVSAVVGAALGAVAVGGLGLFVGFMVGMIAEKSGKKDAMGKGAMIGVVGGGLAGAGLGGVSGWAQGHLLIAAAGAMGGGPLGGAIAGGLFAGISSALSILRRSEKEKPDSDQGSLPPQQPAPQPGNNQNSVQP